MYICWYLMCCVRTSVLLNILFKSSFDLWKASIISFNFCLFTWAAYLLMCRTDMTWTRVSCCFVCSCISCFMHCLISCVSFVVAVHVSHFSASPRRVIGFSQIMGFQVVTGFFILTQFWATVLLIIWLACRIHRWYLCWKIHLEGHCIQSVMLLVGLGVSLLVGELRSSVSWTYIVVCCKSPSDMWAVIIHECSARYAFRTGWNNTDSWCGVSCSFSAKVLMKSRVKRDVFYE